jgi:hypothetical protein
MAEYGHLGSLALTLQSLKGTKLDQRGGGGGGGREAKFL